MPTKKPDTTRGFTPPVPSGRAIMAASLAAVRLDGALEGSVLSPQLHQVLLGMARIRNAVSSFRLEGERVELDRARQVIEAQKPETANERGVLQLARAYREVAEGKLPDFSVKGVQEAHRRIFQGVLDQEIVGELKSKDNVITDITGAVVKFEPTPAGRTAAELESLFAWLRAAEDSCLPPVAAAIFFAEFEAIHPFVDGNGRLGRLLNIALLRRLGLSQSALIPLDTRFFHTSEHYYEFLATTNSGKDYGLWTRYYCSELRSAYEAANRRGDLRRTLAQFPKPSTRAVLTWVLTGSGNWFHRRDYPNPQRYSGPALWGAFQDLVRAGVLEARGEAKGREYRLRSTFLADIYGRNA